MLTTLGLYVYLMSLLVVSQQMFLSTRIQEIWSAPYIEDYLSQNKGMILTYSWEWDHALGWNYEFF